MCFLSSRGLKLVSQGWIVFHIFPKEAMTSFIMSPCFLHQLLRQHGSAFSYYTSMTFWEAEISWFSIITSDKLLSLPELQLPRASHHSWTIVLCCITTFQPTMDQTTYLRTVWSWKNSFLFKNNYFILTITFSLFFFFLREGKGERQTSMLEIRINLLPLKHSLEPGNYMLLDRDWTWNLGVCPN